MTPLICSVVEGEKLFVNDGSLDVMHMIKVDYIFQFNNMYVEIFENKSVLNCNINKAFDICFKT